MPRTPPLRRRGTAAAVAVATSALVLAASAPALDQTAAPPVNAWWGPPGSAGQHGDAGASDTTPLPGPGRAPRLAARFVPLEAACPSILIGRDRLPVALCTAIRTRAPVAHLLDPARGRPLATLTLTRGALFAGVYPYLDQRDRLVLADGSGHLLRIAHARTDGRWRLRVVARTPLRPALDAACPGAQDCGGVVGLAPDARGRVWFAADRGVAGLVSRDGRVRTLPLGRGERVANSIATAPAGTAVATDRALYLLRAGADGRPRIAWRHAYARGAARKPGQLSHGTGSTPTFFGPRTGAELLSILDDASPRARLLVLDARTGARRCATPVLSAGASGSENSPIGTGRSVIVASTYGYPYPAVPEDAGASVPATAPFRGGMARVDVDADGRGCRTVWSNRVRSAAVPKLSRADGLIHTTTRISAAPDGTTSPADRFAYAALRLSDGDVVASAPLGSGFGADTLELAGTIGAGRVLWQGSITGLFRLAPAAVQKPHTSNVRRTTAATR